MFLKILFLFKALRYNRVRSIAEEDRIWICSKQEYRNRRILPNKSVQRTFQSSVSETPETLSARVIDNIDELEILVNNAIQDSIFDISDTFENVLSRQINLIIPRGLNIIINGKGKIFSSGGNFKFLGIDNQIGGILSLTNMIFQGQGGINLRGGTYGLQNIRFLTGSGGAGSTIIAGTGVETLLFKDGNFENCTGQMLTSILDLTVEGSDFLNTAGNGISGCTTILVRDSTFQNGTNSAIVGGTKLVLTRVLFEGNSAGFGSAIDCGANSDLSVSHSSFIRNIGTAGGYNGGAIATEKSTPVNMVFNNCYFEGNEARQGYTNASTGAGFGGHGGAISYYHSSGNLYVKQCYFKENRTTGNSVTSDGGAIAVFSIAGMTNEITIENSLFEGNEARDDAGAIFVEGRSVAGVTATISNNTFYKNKGNAYDNNGTGGAVQLSQSCTGKLTNNTFFGNKQGDGIQRGNDLGVHLLARYTLQNNLFVAPAGSPKNTNVQATSITNSGGNVGLDNAAPQALDISPESVFGSTSPELRDYGSGFVAGIPKSEYETVLKTLMILPESPADDKGVAGVMVPTRDARGKTRNDTTPDAGAIDISWVKFNTDTGGWSDLPPYTLGVNYYNNTNPREYYLISDTGGIVSALDGSNFIYDCGMLQGWDTNPIAKTILYHIGDPVPAFQETLYATCKFSGHTVTFHTNGGSVVPDAVMIEGSSTMEAPEVPRRTAYIFEDWFRDNGSFMERWDFNVDIIISDMTLYAKWRYAGGNNPVIIRPNRKSSS